MNETISAAVLAERHGDVMVLAIRNAPVNALSNAVRSGLFDALGQAIAEPAVKAVVLRGEGKCFSAGADVREFGTLRTKPFGAELAQAIEDCPKPVVALLHGTTLGGGLELALAAHYRMAVPGSTFGLPEVRLGLLPGAGGTQRLPRLVGVAPALDMMLEGRHVPVQAAKDMHLIDEVVAEEGMLAAALAAAQSLAASGVPPRRTREAQALRDRSASLQALAKAGESALRKKRGMLAPGLIIEAVRHAIESPFDSGMAFEAQAFQQCLNSPQRKGLTHVFFAERHAARNPASTGAARPLEHVGVVGGGTMGSGIAVALLDAGLDVTLLERDPASLSQGRARVEGVYERLCRSARMTESELSERLGRLHGTTEYEHLANADLVIEAAFEDMAVKQAIFAELDRVCKRGAVLATNTSFLDVNRIAASTSRPQDVIGLHFFSPANIMPLLEIVVPDQAGDQAVATGFELARVLGKRPVRAGVCDGFIGNRILYSYREAANHMMEDGASPYEIDRALEDFGYAMGPFRTVDLAGGDIGWATRRRQAASRDPRARYVRIADQLCERGWFGQKTGRGYYLYPDGVRVGVPDPEVLELIARERAARGVSARTFSADEIVQRCMAALINEAAKVLAEGIAQRPSDIDVALVNGYGYPRWRGGPMHYADETGLGSMVATLERLAEKDDFFWRPAPLLSQLAAQGAPLSSLNR